MYAGSMGNKKNKLYQRNHRRHVYKKKHIPRKSRDNSTPAHTEASANHIPAVKLEGSRIINLHKLQQYVSHLTVHATRCEGTVTLAGEVRDGLASILSTCCSTCGHTITLETSEKVKGPNGYRWWESNLAAVWGQMATGGGHSQLEEAMSILGVPVMSKKSFTRSEKGIGEWWRGELQEAMTAAGREEKRLAEESGSYHEGIPAITVVVDGGWSKRSHRHSYNAKSGVGIIIGQKTRKLLYIGVRNKYCTSCAQGIPQEQHICYRNWDASSSQMETSIILEGFKEAKRVHGVRYIRFIGDGDSSVYPTLLQNVPVWGHAIQKLECANHACKCYRAALEKLAQENPAYKGRGGLTEKMRRRLTSAARCAIKMRSKENDINKAQKLLEKDLINGPFHCFGHHSRCSPDFCSTAKDRLQHSTLAEGSKEISVEESMEISEEGSADTFAEGEECEGANEEADSSDDIGTFGRLSLMTSTIQ